MKEGIINDLRNLKRKVLPGHKKKHLNSENHILTSDSDQISSNIEIKITLLRNSEEDFKIFKNIITNKDVIFNSWFISSSFDITMIKNYCDNFDLKINLALMDDPDVKLPSEIMKLIGKQSSTQLALNRFFDLEENLKTLKELYQVIINDSANTGLGYFKFEDKSNNLLGGGALILIEDDSNNSIKKCDLAIHILNQHHGIGDICLRNLFHKSFVDHDISEIYSRSARDALEITNFMCKHGMSLIDDEQSGDIVYFINKKMWESSVSNH